MSNKQKQIVYKDYKKEDNEKEFFYRFYFAIENETDVNTLFESFCEINSNVFCIDVHIDLELYNSFPTKEENEAIFSIKAYNSAKHKLKEIVRDGFAKYKNICDEIEETIVSFSLDLKPIVFDFKSINVDDNFYIEHNYWHMQLHPNDDNWNNEVKLLKEKKIIGLSDNILNNNTLEDFRNVLDIGDIVLIKHGSTPLALVIVKGEAIFVEEHLNYDLDWFEWQRSIEILEIYENNHLSDFPSPRGTLNKAINQNTQTYRYIDNLYHNHLGLKYRYNKLRLNYIKIKDYKMFSDFVCNFKNQKDEYLSVVEIIGENGTGKTTLLEIIYNTIKGNKIKQDNDTEIKISFKYNDKNENIYSNNFYTELKDMVIYLPAYIQNTNDVSSLICKYLKKKIIKDNLKPFDAWKALREDLNDVLQPLKSNFVFKRVDEEDKVYFVNSNNDELLAEELSTGEKNVLTKALYIHLADADGKVILIDEPELSLHPRWQRSILGVYKSLAASHNCQIILATHSPLLLSEAKEESIRILKFNDEMKTECVALNGRSYGQKASDIMLDIMGLDSLRSPNIQERLDDLGKMINNSKFEKEKFKEEISKLEKEIGNDDIDIGLLKIDAKNREKEEK